LLNKDFKIIENSQINIEDQTITYVGPQKNAQHIPDAEVIDYSTKGLAVPPFINAHTHLPETLIRGICDDKTLHEWLYDHVWAVEPAMTSSDAKIGALLGIAEMIASGTIGFVDQYFYSNSIAEAVLETGVKAYLAPSIFDTPESKTIEGSFQTNKVVFDRWHGQDNRIFVGFGAHAPYSVPKEWLEEIIEATKERKTILHIHLNETKKELQDAKDTWGCSPIELMDQLGALDYTYAVHCIHTSETDQALLAQHKTPILSCPQSNMKIGAGIAPLPLYLSKNIHVCLGTDGSASNNNLDMLEEVRLVSLVHKALNYDPTLMDSKTVFSLATSNASRLFPIGVYSGVIEEGLPADLVVYNLDNWITTPNIRPFSNLLFAASSNQVALTMSNGKLLYKEGNFLTLDINQIKESAQKATDGMISRSGYKLAVD
jgi:5-methylthioadenosine/S-adenosylhomocysteine deaminase